MERQPTDQQLHRGSTIAAATTLTPPPNVKNRQVWEAGREFFLQEGNGRAWSDDLIQQHNLTSRYKADDLKTFEQGYNAAYEVTATGGVNQERGSPIQ